MIEDRINVISIEDYYEYFNLLKILLQRQCEKFNKRNKKNIVFGLEHMGLDELNMGPEKCLEKLKERESLDLILTDHYFESLPFDGMDLIRLIKDQKLDVPVIMLSERMENESIVLHADAIRAGARGFYTKSSLVTGKNVEEQMYVFFSEMLQQVNAYRDHRELFESSLRDPLTGLFNRRRFNMKLEDNLQNRKNTTTCVAIIDIDDFKYVNDTFGHPGGDEYLVQISQRLNSNIKRKNDLIVRLGGDELGLILTNASKEYVEEKLGVVYDTLTQPYDLGISIFNSPDMSIGACLYYSHEGPIDVKFKAKELYTIADENVYIQKGKKGTNRRKFSLTEKFD